MKGPSFIFGLGCGIIFVTVVFYTVYSFGYTTNATTAALAVTDDEIIDQATKLGMIFFDTLPDTNQPVLMSDEEIIKRATDLGMAFSAAETVKEEVQEEVQEKVNEGETEETPEASYIEIFIPPGLSATDIAELLQDKGIVDDEDQFLNFVKINQQTKKLKNGYLKVPTQGSYEDVLNALQNRKPSS